jgi:hypothetical protein
VSSARTALVKVAVAMVTCTPRPCTPSTSLLLLLLEETVRRIDLKKVVMVVVMIGAVTVTVTVIVVFVLMEHTNHLMSDPNP